MNSERLLVKLIFLYNWKRFDKQDVFYSDIVNFQILNSDFPPVHPMVYILQFDRFASVSSHIININNRNKI